MGKIDESNDVPATKGRGVKWCPVAGINSCCADIGLVYGPRRRLTLRLRFSHVRGNPPKDILLEFEYVAAFRFEDECFSGSSLPDKLPPSEGKLLPTFAFPLLIIEDSPWAKMLADRHPQGEGCIHYAFPSWSDTVEVLAPPPVRVEWVPATDE